MEITMNKYIQSHSLRLFLVLSLAIGANSVQAMPLFTTSVAEVEPPMSFSLENAVWEVFTQHRVNTMIPDAQGGIWVENNDSLVHYHNNGSQKQFKLTVNAIVSDHNGGVWVGADDSLVHFHADDSRETFTLETLENFEFSEVSLLETDEKGGVWLGTNLEGPEYGYGSSPPPEWFIKCLQSGVSRDDCFSKRSERQLLHFHADGRWDVVRTSLASNTYQLISDGMGGLWIANGNYPGPTGSSSINSYSALSHLHADGTWQTIFSLPGFNFISDTLLDGNGGIWVNMTAGIGSGDLVHIQAEGSWEKVDSYPSAWSSTMISFLQADNNGGIWMGTDNGLVHMRADNTSEVSLLDNHLLSRVVDSTGTWIGTTTGLVHLDTQNQIVGFYTNNSGLPDSVISTLAFDKHDGLWVNSSGGLAHLTFGQKHRIINNISNDTPEQGESIREAFLTEKRAALLIHPQSGADDDTVDFMATYAYRTFHARGYDQDEIYLLSYKPDLDFNGDARPDFYLVDAPVTLADFRNNNVMPRALTVADIQAAFDWAKSQGELDSPLFVTFVGNGLPGELLLDSLSQERLSVEMFKALLDDYQNTTGNAVVVLIEAPHSGTLILTLAAPNRVIITSTDNEVAYYSDLGRSSFLKGYFDQLRQGDNLWNAWQFVNQTLKMDGMRQQTPKLEDVADGEMARQLCLNGCFGTIGAEITLIPSISPAVVRADQRLELKVKIPSNGDSVRQVWASLMTSNVAKQQQGDSLLATPIISLEKVAEDQWEGHYQFDSSATLGQYRVTFKAETHTQFITEASPITLTLQGQPPYFEMSTNRLFIPAVTVPNRDKLNTYQAELVLISVKPDKILKLDTAVLKRITDTHSVSSVHFNTDSGIVQIPLLEIVNESGEIETFSLDLQLIPQTQPLQFKVDNLFQESKL